MVSVSSEKSSELDLNKLFMELRTRWLAAKTGRIGTDLCLFLDTRKQLVSCYATGSDNRRPPMWAVMRIMNDLGLELRLTGSGGVLTKLRKGKDGPATRIGDAVIPWRISETQTE